MTPEIEHLISGLREELMNEGAEQEADFIIVTKQYIERLES